MPALSPRWLSFLILGIALLPCAWAADDSKPITTAKGEIGELLQKWWKEGTAAGNVGDWYDNRDGAHSDLNTSPYPQLSRVVYTPEDIKLRKHWAAQTITRPNVTFGNSSTSAPPLLGGSNPRSYYTQPAGLALLYNHYTHNNLYIYPEHRDHDAGHNGKNDGFGDLYPTNTPYLLISQGSSGSDQPFMRAVPFTLAAFRPEVKKKLIETGLLMPTVQMIFRSSNKHLANPKEYLTGKAHPTVFEGANVDELKMVKMAHDITLKDIPPMVQLMVTEEDQPVAGRDYFEMISTEKLCDTPAVIARIWRGKDRTRRMVVSAEGSYDTNKRPLTFEWVVLRGDAEKIQIKPRNAARSEVEIIVPYHERRPIASGSKMESNRVDIGVFVHNGVYYSAPGFITWLTLDSESRTCDREGRPLEMGYGMGETTVTVTDWKSLLTTAASDSLASRLLKFSKEEQAAFKKAGEEHAKLHEVQTKAQEALKVVSTAQAKARAEAEAADKNRAAIQKANDDKPTEVTKKALLEAQRALEAAREALKKLDAEVPVATKEAQAATKAVNDFLDRKRDDLSVSVRARVERALETVLQDVNFANDHADVLTELKKVADNRTRASITQTRDMLMALGMAKEEGPRLLLLPLREGKAPVAERLTPYEKAMIARHNGALLAGLVLQGAVTSNYQVNYVDPRLMTPRSWRDVYRYDAKGNALGWSRYDGQRMIDFNAEGLMVMEKDAKGRCLKARTVKYELAPTTRPGEWAPLRAVPDAELVTYEYDSDQDFKGRVTKREKDK